MASFRNRILVVALLVLGGIGLVSAQTTGAVVSIATAPTVGGACYTGMAIYVVQSTGDHYTCAGGVWVAIGGGGGGDQWKLWKTEGGGSSSLPSWWVDPLSDSVFGDADTDGTWNIRYQNGGMSGPVTIYIQDNTDYVRWLSNGFLGSSNLNFNSFGNLVFNVDDDDSSGDEIQFTWPSSGVNERFKFTFNGLVFEGLVDDANEIRLAAATPTGTRTATLPDKTGGVVLLNGTTYPTGSTVCAQFNTNGLLEPAAGACSTSGGDDVSVDGTAVVGADFRSTGNIDFYFTGSGPAQILADVRGDTITSAMIVANTITAADINPTITWGTADIFDMSLNTAAVANTGIRLPQNTSCVLAGASEGQVCWETDVDKLWIGTGGSGYKEIGGTAGSGTVTDVFDCNGSATPDCGGAITMSASDKLRARTSGTIGVRYATSAPSNPCSTSFEKGDVQLDYTTSGAPKLWVCDQGGTDQWREIGSVSANGISTIKEDNGSAKTNQTALDFLTGFDTAADGTAETNVSLDIGELDIGQNYIWMGTGAYSSQGWTAGTAHPYLIPSCAPTEKLTYTYANVPGLDNQAWSCEAFSTVPVAASLDIDGTDNTVPGNGVDPEVWVSDSSNLVYFNPTGGTGVANWSWRVSNTVIEPRVAVGSEIKACTFTQLPAGSCGIALLGTDDDQDGTQDSRVELSSSGLKLYVGEGSTTPAVALVTGGLDANNDGVADNLSANGLNKSMPNYSESFTSQTSVTMVHNLRSGNLITTCYDGSDVQISPATISIGSSPGYDVTVTFGSATTGRCVVNGGTTSKYTTSFSNQITIVIPQADIGIDPYASHVTCYDNEDPRNRVEPDSVQIDDATLDMTINFAVGQSGRCVVS